MSDETELQRLRAAVAATSRVVIDLNRRVEALEARNMVRRSTDPVSAPVSAPVAAAQPAEIESSLVVGMLDEQVLAIAARYNVNYGPLIEAIEMVRAKQPTSKIMLALGRWGVKPGTVGPLLKYLEDMLHGPPEQPLERPMAPPATEFEPQEWELAQPVMEPAIDPRVAARPRGRHVI